MATRAGLLLSSEGRARRSVWARRGPTIPIDWMRAVRGCFTRDAVLYSAHARREMLTEALGVIADQEVAEARALVVTVYQPDPRRWEDYRRRRR